MKNDNITYTTPEEQLEKLLAQNLIIEDAATAIEALELFGYSNLIKSYREPYMINVNGEKKYRSGVSFGQLTSLYILDKNLRNSISTMLFPNRRGHLDNIIYLFITNR